MLIVKLSARSKRHIPDALLIDRVPAGFEIENMNLSQGPQMAEFTVGNVNIGSAMQDARIKHREYRDDRYVAAVRLERGADWLHVFYMVRVVSPGRFVVPAPYAEDMYRAELRAIGPPSPAITISDPFAPRHDAEPEPPATAASGA
jgi:uncharacterized protein YfaS (alpha-2-macroglobulin family)